MTGRLSLRGCGLQVELDRELVYPACAGSLSCALVYNSFGECVSYWQALYTGYVGAVELTHRQELWLNSIYVEVNDFLWQFEGI